MSDELDDEDVQPTQAPSSQSTYPTSTSYPKTDLGNADYFADLFGGVLRYDQSRKRWLVWRGHRWEPDALKKAEEAAQTAARKRLLDAVSLPAGNGKDAQGQQDPVTHYRSEAIKWAVKSEDRFKIEAVLALAQKKSSISVQTSEGWDDNPWLLGVPNGVIDLQRGHLRSGKQEDHITLQAGVPYDPSAQCPRWDAFISEIFDGDDELVTFVRRSIGYTLTGDLREDCWFGCHGIGSNGKSTFFRVLHQIFGDYRYVAPFSLVERSSDAGGRRDFDIAYLQNKRFVMAAETREGGVWDEERLKRLSGGDPLHAEIKHGAEFEFLPTHKLWFMFNHQPRVRDHSLGFWRRVRLIPFARRFEDEQKDKLLEHKLTAELKGILAWTVRACLEWQREGLQIPQAVLSASQRYEADEDPLSVFIAKHVRMDGSGFELSAAYRVYKDWCRLEMVDHPLGKNRFGALLEPRGFLRSKRKDVARFENGRLITMCTCMSNPCKC